MGSKKHRNRPVINITKGNIAIDGGVKDGSEVICKKCSYQLCINMHRLSVVDVSIRCPSCMIVNLVGKFMETDALITPNVCLSSGTYSFSDHLELKGGQIVSEKATKRYEGWVGYGVDVDFRLEVESLTETWEHILSLIGMERYKKELSRIEKSRLSGAVLKDPHRAVQLIVETQEFVSKLENNQPRTMDSHFLDDLTATQLAFKRWSNHPLFNQFIKNLSDSRNFNHDLMVLMVASHFIDTGHGVALNLDSEEDESLPDILVYPDLKDVLEIEVKAPVVKPTSLLELSDAEAEKIVDRSITKASSQLSRDGSGLVVMAFSGLSNDSFNKLSKAADSLLKKHARRKGKAHVAGVSIFNLTSRLEQGSKGEITYVPSIKIDVKWHSVYKGKVRFKSA